MKRQVPILLLLCILLAGCTAPAVESPDHTHAIHTQPPAISTQPPLPQQTEAPAETVSPMEYQKPFTAVSLTPYRGLFSAQDGTTVYHYSSQHLTLVMNDHALAASITQDFTVDSEELLQAALNDLNAVKTDYTGQSDWYPYFCDITYQAPRLDQAALSLAGYQLFYDGTNRSGENTFAFNYDMQTGIRLHLDDVLIPDFSADILVGLITDALADRAGSLYSDYSDSIAGLFHSNTPVDNWYFTETGLCFFFNPYDIAPQSEGTILAEIPYQQLPGMLQDAYFPDEFVEFSGTLSMTPFADADTSQIHQYAEVVLDTAGSQYLLCPIGTALDVTVQTGSWTKNGTFLAEATVFAAEALSQGNALMLQLPTDELGSLCITYRTGSELIITPWQTN